jgi:PEP-CTERM motif
MRTQSDGLVLVLVGLLAALAMFFGFVPSSRAGSVVVVVPGTSDPWLAGMPNGSTASGGDVAPAQSPVLVPGILDPAGSPMTFSASGLVANTSLPSDLDPPDGRTSDVISHDAGAQNGISNIFAPINSLLGIFLGPGQPDTTPEPPGLMFDTPNTRDYLTLSPMLKQVFFIGDGHTSTNQVQQIIIPVGATRLFLGTMDGSEWSNNSGSFTVTVTGVTAIPEPSGLMLLGTGAVGFLGYAARRRARPCA